MTEKKSTSLDTSILYRCNQKYYDRLLAEYELGYTQMLLLFQIYEAEGIPMNELAVSGSFDKGTITKSVQRLEQLGYLSVENSESDKRSKLLFTTEKARKIIPGLYLEKQRWFNYLMSDLSEDEKTEFLTLFDKVLKKAVAYNETHFEETGVKIYGLQKTTCLDYPGHLAATVFTGGCNYRCPFCHNRSLVFLEEADQEISESDVLEYLSKRSGVLDGVALTGGEPLLQPGLKNFIKAIKGMGLKVKLDTNGSSYTKLKELVEEGLVDYVAMDIKNSLGKYSKTIGIENFNTENVEKCVEYLKSDVVDYEFRTTTVEEFHEASDFEEIGKWLKGAKRYYLQNFEDHGNCIVSGLHPRQPEELKQYLEIVKPYIKEAGIRGVGE